MDDHYSICEDCALFHANGETGELDPDRMAEVTGFDGFLAVDCGEDGEHCDTFSWSPCDACGTRLGGGRHRAWLVG